MKKPIIAFIVSLLCIIINVSSIYSTMTTSLMVGTIQFPLSLPTIPAIRIYSCGKKIPFPLCEIDNESKQFMFRIPQIVQQNHFYLLVTQEIHFETHAHYHENNHNNTINYLKVPSHQPYAFYELTLATTSDNNNKTASTWTIHEKNLNTYTRRIPDETIIVCYDPASIDSLSGGSAFELPTIKLKHNLLTLVDAKELQTSSDKIIIAAINSDTVHATIQPKYQQKITTKSPVTLVAPVV